MKNFYTLLFLSIFSSSILEVSAQWRTTTPLGSDISDIMFTDQYTGYAVGHGGAIGACQYELSLFKTVDAGENWIRIQTGTTGQIRAVHFANQLIGWTAGASSEILKTTDGGMTWNQVDYGVGTGYNDIWFRDVNNGFVLGDNGMLRRSTNGGSSWQTIASGVSADLERIHFFDANLGFIVCSDGNLLRTTNGGSNWSVVNTGATLGKDVFFTSASDGYFLGRFSGTNYLYATQDGGLNWAPIATINSNYARKLFFTNPNNGYIITGGEGILKTTDAGVTWNQILTMNGIYDDWQGIYFTDDNTGYISGGDGRINKTVDGGLTWKNHHCGLEDDLTTVAAPHKDTAYFGDNRGIIYKTENAGVSYKQQIPIQSDQVNKVYFLNTQTGFTSRNVGTIHKTTDGGEDWIAKPTNSPQRITDFSFVNDQIGYASAFGGLIFKTVDNGETWDSIPTGFNEDFNDIWFNNEDTGYVISGYKALRTFDGGSNWIDCTPVPTVTGYMKDIGFSSNRIGFLIISGKVLITRDYGVTWDVQNPTATSGTLNEMDVINDSTIYFTYNTSQRVTTDSAHFIGSQSTACLANNYGMFGIAMTDGGDYGYAVGGISGLVHQKDPPEIIASIVSTNSFCAGENIFVGFLGKGFYSAGNIFTVQLSDASGNFASPTNIGTVDLSSMYAYKSGVITALIPPGTPSGSGYRIRVVASNPGVISPDNGFDITINSAQTPMINLVNANGSLCEGDSLVLTTNTIAAGLNPEFSWTINGSIINHNASTLTIDSLVEGDSVKVKLISSLGCVSVDSALSNVFIVDYADPILTGLMNDTLVCEGDCIVLSPMVNNSLSTVSWSSSFGLNDSTILNPTACLTDTISYVVNLIDTNSCKASDTINVWVNPSPIVSIAAFNPDTLCDNDAAVSLPVGIPAGGNYTGIGVGGGNFDPVIAGLGTHNIVYTYNDSNLCSNSDTTKITVEVCTNITESDHNNQIILYPNPTFESFTIKNLGQITHPIHLEIYDLMSRPIFRINKIVDGQTIDISQLSNGIYYARFVIGKEFIVKKILKY